MSSTDRIKSVNFHITSKCNYHCRFCYTKHLNPDVISFDNAVSIMESLREFGIDKLNFVGGEPLMHPHFFRIVKSASDLGFTVCMTSNASLMTKENISQMADYISWIGISVDSMNNQIEATLGRGFGNHVTNAISVSDMIHEIGINLKINTTVTKLNFRENLKPLIHRLQPRRWKVFQVLHIAGQNDACIRELGINNEEFGYFVKNHQSVRLRGGIAPVFEQNSAMIDSYFMIGPSGNVIINHGGRYEEISLETLFNEGCESRIKMCKYTERNGLYSWN